jgi:hypothetical protein
MEYRDRRPHPDIYRCHHVDHKLFQRVCRMKQVQARIIEPAVFAAIWKHLINAELLIANARAYYDSLPSKPEAAALETELAEVMARIDRMGEMVYLGTYDKAKGNAKILDDQKRIAEIKADLKTAGVSDLPEKYVIENACQRIAEGRMPSRFDTQRPVLEKLLNLKVYWDGQDATIEGKVPVPAASAAAAGRGWKCDSRVNGTLTSTLYIPFKIKERLPTAPGRGSRVQSLKGWETRRAKKERRAA